MARVSGRRVDLLYHTSPAMHPSGGAQWSGGGFLGGSALTGLRLPSQGATVDALPGGSA